MQSKSMQRLWAPLLMEVMRYSALNVVMQLEYTTE